MLPTHGETAQFLVPQPGTYTITISDQVSCDLSFDMDMGACVPVTFNLPNVFANAGPPTQNVCLDITVENFTDITTFQFLLQWDNSILTYTGVNLGQLGPPELFFGPPSPTNFLNFSWTAERHVLPINLVFNFQISYIQEQNYIPCYGDGIKEMKSNLE